MASPSTAAGGGPIEAAPGSITAYEYPRANAEELYNAFGEEVVNDVIEKVLDELIDAGFVRESDDLYSAAPGIDWTYVSRFSCPLKRTILKVLVGNPHTFFALRNTQTGKSAYTAREINRWATAKNVKVVSVLIVDNDKSLSDQTKDGILRDIGEVTVFHLSSSAKERHSVDDIVNYIDAYAYAPRARKMPLIIALNNDEQLKKVQRVMHHIAESARAGSPLRYGIVFDEADKVYPPKRDKEYALGDGIVTSFAKLFLENNAALHRLGFVTATDGDLLDDFPECANAYFDPAPPNDPNYRGMHTVDATVKYTDHPRTMGHDAYAEKILRDNAEYFRSKVTVKNGSREFRKTIVHAGARVASMDSFAKQRVAEDCYAITINMYGVKVFRPNKPVERRSAKGVRLSDLLFKLYTELGLNDKPLFLIGRRKVDRGIGFHYAPRDGATGLIFTDMILGRVDDKDDAVQKAGRLSGIVAQCPQYPGTLTWWTNEHTGGMVLRHNAIVDSANANTLVHTALSSVTRAKASAGPVATNSQGDTIVREEVFSTEDEAREWAEAQPWNQYEDSKKQKQNYSISAYRRKTTNGVTTIQYNGEAIPLWSYQHVREHPSHVAEGLGTKIRLMPVLKDGSVKYVVIHSRKAKDPSK